MNTKIKIFLSGLVCGILNGLLGSGGGMIIVPTLISNGIKTRKAHATSVSIILCLSIFSSIMYLVSGKINITDALPYLPSGLIGSIIGGKVLQKINTNILCKIFGVLMAWAAIKMLI